MPSTSTRTARPPPAYIGPPGPPNIRPLTSKRPHRRGPYACDECRLRKRACDAAQPCGPCRRSDTDCTYLFRKPAPRPTSRIRTLQNHLRQARGWLQQVKDKTPVGITGLDLDECLRILDFSLPDETSSPPQPLSSQPSAARLESTPQGPHNMLIGRDRFVGNDGELTFFYGAYSDTSFISRTIELLEIRPSAARNPQLCVISDLASRPLYGHARHESLRTSGDVCRVPHDAESLLDVVFDRSDLMLCFLPEQQLRDLAANAPDASAPKNMLSLLHLVLALGHLYNFERHREIHCEEAVQQATRHFHAGMTMGQSGLTQDLTSLAALLCAIVFLLSSYRTASAYSLIGTACSAAIRLGLFSTCPLPSGVTSDVRRTRDRLLAGVVTVDMLGSLILDLPAFLNKDLLPHARLEELAIEAEASDDIFLAAQLRQSMLLAIPISVRSQVTGSEELGEGRVRALQKAQKACQRWKNDTSSLTTKLGHSPAHHGAKTDLEMMFSFCQIMLFRPHLHYIRDMYLGQTVSVAESYYALACIKVASSTILLVENLRDQSPLPMGESWLSIYAVFSSVMCLVFLVAAHPATTLPSVAWQRACRGIRIIAANRCADNISAVCLELLKLVTQSLRETIYIDFDRIEVSTTSNCSNTCERLTSGYTELSKDDRPSDEDVSNMYRQATAADCEEGERSNDYWDDLVLDVENEADKMLEQAEALPVGIDLQELLELDNNE